MEEKNSNFLANLHEKRLDSSNAKMSKLESMKNSQKLALKKTKDEVITTKIKSAKKTEKKYEKKEENSFRSRKLRKERKRKEKIKSDISSLRDLHRQRWKKSRNETQSIKQAEKVDDFFMKPEKLKKNLFQKSDQFAYTQVDLEDPDEKKDIKKPEKKKKTPLDFFAKFKKKKPNKVEEPKKEEKKRKKRESK